MHDHDLLIMPELVDLQIVEQVPSGDLLLFAGQGYPEIVPYPDMVGDIVMVEETEPVLSDELSVSQKTADAVPSEPADEIVYQCDTLIRIGISPLVEHPEHKRYGNIPIAYTEHQYVDVLRPELPVGPVHHKDKGVLYWQELENESGYALHGQFHLGHKALHPSKATVGQRCRGKSGRDLGVVDGLYLA